jgi:N-acetylglucosaminyldiphosphoundecaprenol N-acetyl-beta-D-mannosaminyltransferase
MTTIPRFRSTASASLLGVRFTIHSSDALLPLIAEASTRRLKSLIVSGNVHAFNLAYTSPWLCWFLNRADAIRIDGVGVRLGLRILGHSTPARATWADFAWQLAAFAEPRGFTFYFLGARPGVAEKAAARLKERHPNLRIVGTHHGYFDKAPGSPENEAVVEAISAVKPNILIVGFGMPLQEHWLLENWERLDANVALTAGAAFDYISGELRRGPRWMTDNGLEWLARLIIEPRRLWRRYLIGNPLFLWRVLKQRLGLLRLPEEA